MRANFKSWRESASLILVGKTAFSPHTISHEFNYKLLTLKRSKQSGFMPGTYVFPGGNVSKADTSKDWLKLYERFGFKLETFEKLNPKGTRPPIFITDESSEIPKYISLRITAIRETFEESGILICRSFKMNYKERLARWASFIGGHEVLKWQEKVHKDPLQFYELCSQFEVYPDVWSLKEWSNWATPAPMPIRFDTAFFLAAFQQMPPTSPDKMEVQHLQWATPSEYAARNKTEEVMLPPPQFYEISRLQNFSDISNLLRFSSDRAGYGTERYMPYRVNTESGVYSILPGDDLYPACIDPTVEATPYMKNIPQTSIQNRIEHIAVYGNRIVTKNFVPQCNHWATPSEYAAQNQIGEIKLPPTQCYEISRLRNFSDISNLLRFASDRASYGVDRYLPYLINSETGVYSILPGDDLYPASVDPPNETITYLKYIPETNIQNRIAHISVYRNSIVTKNFIPQRSHVAPLQSKL